MTTITKYRKIVEAATPGPWGKSYFDENEWWINNGKEGMDEYGVCCIFSLNPREERDADFIATFNPAMIGKLLDLWEAAHWNYQKSDHLIKALAALNEGEQE